MSEKLNLLNGITNQVQNFRLLLYLLLTCLFFTGLSAGSMQNESDLGVVKTDSGYVSGIESNGVWEYLGIPYAAPPVGDLRWKPPVPVEPWDDVKETKKYCAICPQPPSPDTITGEISVNMSEDCLYLNVWTPATKEGEKLPVMVFFHGGAFISGAGSLYNGVALAKKGVVIVTINYRLGALGFLAHPELSNESPNNSSGNYGILDQVAALEWIQQNIGAFGGDPTKVTIFGESAGASSIFVHLVSPQSYGLYQQAIIESGPFWTNGTTISIFSNRTEAEGYGEEYTKSLGYSGPNTIQQIRNVSARDLIMATPYPSSMFGLMNSLQFRPTIDGWLIPDSPDTLFELRGEKPVPLIIGTNRDEGTMLAANVNMTVQEYEKYIRDHFEEDADAVLAEYPAKSTEEVQSCMERIMTDYDFSDAAKFVAGSMADLNQDTYLYRFSYVLPGQTGGAFHGSELLMIFRPAEVPLDNISRNISNAMMDFWVGFAKTGNPDSGMNQTWPQYTAEGDQYLDIGDILVVKSEY